MTYDEIDEIQERKKIFYTGYKGPVISNYYGKDKIIGVDDRKYGFYIMGAQGNYGMYCILPILNHPKKGEVIETWSGNVFLFQNILKSHSYSCLTPGTKTGRSHIQYNSIKSINGVELYEINPMLNDLLSILK